MVQNRLNLKCLSDVQKKSSSQLKPRRHDWAKDEICEVAFGLVFVDEITKGESKSEREKG